MLADLEHLIELQQVDLRLQELTRQLESFPQRRAEAEQELKQAREKIETARTRHTESLKQRKTLELDVQQVEERVSKHKSQMYEVKSNEAYRALQEEVAAEEKQKAKLEDQELEIMLAAEELEKLIKTAEAERAQVEQRVKASLRQLEETQAGCEKEVAALNTQRDTLRGQTDEEALAVYDRIARGHGGIALAEARDEVCLVCRIHIRPQTFAEVRRGDQLHYCESCHRILYYRAPAAETPVEAGLPGAEAGG